MRGVEIERELLVGDLGSHSVDIDGHWHVLLHNPRFKTILKIENKCPIGLKATGSSAIRTDGCK
jgi:hypothetical protein